MARIRNTKQLGQRVDRTYLKRLYPIPRWRRVLTLIFVAAGLGWLGLYAIARNQTPYTAGALTPAHAFLGKRCAVCHGSSAGIGKRVADQQCAPCHDGPIHQDSQTFAPACITCHFEHRGLTQLASVGDGGCVSCHSNLQTKTGKRNVAASIDSFKSHPEFAAVRAGGNPPGLLFNHAKHVGELSQKCSDCHVPSPVPAGETGASAKHNHVSSRALMNIPTYAATCMPCHPLTIDDKIADAAPHDKPEVVHKFVQEQLTKYIAAHTGDLGKEGTPGSASAWVQFKILADEKKLTEETCGRCHMFVSGSSPAFADSTVLPTKLQPRWYKKAAFDHSAHQGLTCASCHPAAATSKVATDNMLPGIAVCRSCHSSGSTTAGANCSTCHVYHNWSKEKAVDGKYMIEQMTKVIPQGHPNIN